MKRFIVNNLLSAFLVSQLLPTPAAARPAAPPHSDDFYRRQALGGRCLTAAQRAADAQTREETSTLLDVRLEGFNAPPPCETSAY